MPKTYTNDEKKAIKERLIHHAAECMALYGIRRTTVDELVRRAKIPKGTFYLFYPTKEALLFEVFLMLHDEIQNSFIEKIEQLGGKITADSLADSFFDACNQIEQTNLANILASGELETLLRKLPPETVARHFSHDDHAVEKLLGSLPSVNNANAAVFSAALRGVCLLTLHRNEIGEGFDEALKLILTGISQQLLGGKDHD